MGSTTPEEGRKVLTAIIIGTIFLLTTCWALGLLDDVGRLFGLAG